MNKLFAFALVASCMGASLCTAGDCRQGDCRQGGPSQWATGCCEHEPLPSDHLWDDYCAEKQRGKHCGGARFSSCGTCIPACSRWRPRSGGHVGGLLHGHRGFSKGVEYAPSCASGSCAQGGGCACQGQAPAPAPVTVAPTEELNYQPIEPVESVAPPAPVEGNKSRPSFDPEAPLPPASGAEELPKE